MRSATAARRTYSWLVILGNGKRGTYPPSEASAEGGSMRGGNGFVLRILNDGSPFDADKVPGPELGHFGLSNMRERAKRSGMAIVWGTEGKWTSVKIER